MTWLDDGDVQLYHGDARYVLAGIAPNSVQTCVTSPPYWGLRDYGEQDQIGLEADPEAYVLSLCQVFAQVWRVLHDDGTLWLNLGDSYAAGLGSLGRNDAGRNFTGGGGNREGSGNPGRQGTHARFTGLKPKDLVGIPWRVAFALQANGWYLRSAIIWSKPNPMPESVSDRPTKSHEYLFLLSKRAQYFFDSDAIREAHTAANLQAQHQPAKKTSDHAATRDSWVVGERYLNPLGRNARSVWEIVTQPTPEAHFACVDDQTEALTPYGWRRHADLSDGDLIAMYDPQTDECRYAPATFHRYDYDGDLVVIEKRDSSQRLTPNHRCYVRRRSGWTGIVPAEELRPGMEILMSAPLLVDEIKVDGVGEKLAALLGWYVTEGHQNHDDYVTIYQSQSANPKKVSEIRRLLVGVGADFHESERTRGSSTEVAFGIRGDIGRFLQGCGKRVGLDTIRLPHDQATAMFDAMIDGDGHRRADGRCCIIQKDKASIDRMQMLALRLGYRAVVSERLDGVNVLYLTRGRWLTLRGTNGTHEPIGREHYEGVVWCPRVETGLWMARRRGRPFITGNTYPEALVRRCILAGTSEAGECSVCGAPWMRVVERAERPNVQRGSSRLVPGENGRSTRMVGQAYQDWLDENPPQTTGWTPSCACGAPARPQMVLDPFIGSGTTALVARKHGRRAVGIDLSEEYLGIASRRLGQQSLFSVRSDTA